MVPDYLCVPGIDRAVTLSEYAKLEGVREADVLAIVGQLKIPATYFRGQWWIQAPPNSEARLDRLRRPTPTPTPLRQWWLESPPAPAPMRTPPPQPNESEKIAPAAPKPTPQPAAAAQPNYEARPAQLRGDGEKIMTRLEYERAKFALEHALKRRSRRYVGLAILFCVAWAAVMVAASFITYVAAAHWNNGWTGLATLAVFYAWWLGWAIPVSLAERVIERPGSKLNHTIGDLQGEVRIYEDQVRAYETARETAAWEPYKEQLEGYKLRCLASDQGAIGLLMPLNNTEPKSKRRVAQPLTSTGCL